MLGEPIMANPTVPDAAPQEAIQAAEIRDQPATTWALGSLAVFLFAAEAFTGLALLFHYRPGADAAADLVDLREASAFGFVQELHHWGSHALVIVVWLHLLRVLASASYRSPRHYNWAVGVALLILTLLLATTGTALSSDGEAGKAAPDGQALARS